MALTQHKTKNKYSLIYDDNDILILSKEHGVCVIPGRTGLNSENTLLAALNKDFGKVFVVHRLDAGTGGIMVFAKTAFAHSSLSLQFEHRNVLKKYLAVTNAVFPDQTLMLPIAFGNKGRYKINFKSGKPAVTSFCKISSHNNHALYSVQPFTGRSHQIRVHLKALKAPLYLDWLYNKPADDRRLTLFAHSIAFKHPVTGKKLLFQASISPFIINVIQALELSMDNVYL